MWKDKCLCDAMHSPGSLGDGHWLALNAYEAWQRNAVPGTPILNPYTGQIEVYPEA